MENVPDTKSITWAIFATDERVIAFAQKKFEVREGDEAGLRAAMALLWTVAKNGTEPAASWYQEAEALSDRVGKHWRDAPRPSLVETLREQSALEPFGFPVTLIPACERVDVEIVSVDLMRLYYLVIDEAVASCLSVEQISVGKASIGVGPIPGSMFATDAFPRKLIAPTIHPHTAIRVGLRNIYMRDVTVQMAALALTASSLGWTAEKDAAAKEAIRMLREPEVKKIVIPSQVGDCLLFDEPHSLKR